MAVGIYEFEKLCAEILQPELFQDYCPNGLQVEGSRDISKIVAGVTASRALIEAAINAEADAIVVHHGYFWKGEDARVRGMKKQRLALLLEHGISLFAYHLPLDAHPEFGNNRQLADKLNFTVDQQSSGQLMWVGELPAAMSLAALTAQVASQLQREPQAIAGGDHEIRRIAWCTGAAQNYIDQAGELGVDAFLSGEISEPTVHFVRENGLHYIAAGHHATERYGVQALCAELSRRLGLAYQFIDIDNPV